MPGIASRHHAAAPSVPLSCSVTRHGGVGIPVVAELVERALPRGEGQLTIERPLRPGAGALSSSDHVARPRSRTSKPASSIADTTIGSPFGDRERDVDLVLRVIERDVERRDPCVRKAAIAIERLDPFEVGVERACGRRIACAPTAAASRASSGGRRPARLCRPARRRRNRGWRSRCRRLHGRRRRQRQ